MQNRQTTQANLVVTVEKAERFSHGGLLQLLGVTALLIQLLRYSNEPL